MKEEEPNWFPRWEENELPLPEELMPLTQTLITPDLALAFDIFQTPNSNTNHNLALQHHAPNLSMGGGGCVAEHESSEVGGGGGNSGGGGGGGGAGGGGEEQARTLKRPRLVWTPQLHKRFVDAVSHLGIKHAVPKTIMQLMSVEGLTRENVASHLQKYRLYLKRMQGISSGGVGSHASVSHSDEQLFASGPIPHHFLSQRPAPVGGGCGGGGGGPDPFMPFVQVSALHQHHHHQMAAAAVAAHHQQQQFYHHRHIGSVGSTPNFEHHGSLLPRQPQQGGMQRMVGPLSVGLMPTMAGVSGLAEDSDSAATAAGRDGRRVLTLFPTNDD